MTETFYDALGVSADATVEEIETAYREEIKQVHPDVSDDVDASDRTKRLNKAKRVLTDAEERARYDRIGHRAYVGDDPGTTRSGSATGTDDETGAPSSAGGSASAPDGGDRGRTSTGGGRPGDGYADDGRPGNEQPGDGRASGRRSGDAGEADAGSGPNWSGTAQRGRGRRDPERSGAERRRQRRARASDRAGHGTGATTRSTSSTGPDWQSATATTDGSRSARRQAAATGQESANVDWSWNTWDPRDAWAVRQGDGRRLHPRELFPTGQSLVLLVSTFVCYPFFVGSVLFPGFPLVVRMVVLLCTLFTFAYLLSMPDVAAFVFGGWSVLGTLALLAVPGVGVFSLLGVGVLVSTWLPLGISILTFSLVQP